jgi:small-conductance mechanosensitive channel
VKARITFINPSSEALKLQITERAAKPVSSVSSSTPANTQSQSGSSTTAAGVSSSGTQSGEAQRMLQRALARIEEIINLKITDDEKVAQLLSIENEAKREIKKENDLISEYKEKLGIN